MRLNINTFQSTSDNETYFVGTDENGQETVVIFDTIELLEWLDISYMKKQSKKYISKI